MPRRFAPRNDGVLLCADGGMIAAGVSVAIELPALGEAELKHKSGMLGIDRSAGLWPACRPKAGATVFDDKAIG
jgi:hypothetical protein